MNIMLRCIGCAPDVYILMLYSERSYFASTICWPRQNVAIINVCQKHDTGIHLLKIVWCWSVCTVHVPWSVVYGRTQYTCLGWAPLFPQRTAVLELHAEEPLNNGHIVGSSLVHCREIVLLSEVTNVLLKSINWGCVYSIYRGCLFLRVSIIRLHCILSTTSHKMWSCGFFWWCHHTSLTSSKLCKHNFHHLLECVYCRV